MPKPKHRAITYSEVIDMLVKLIREDKSRAELLECARYWAPRLRIEAELLLGDARGVAAGKVGSP